MSSELNDDARSLIRDAIAEEPVADSARRAGLKRSVLARAARLGAAAAAATGTTGAASALTQGAATLPGAAVPASVLPGAGAVAVLLAKGAAVGLIVGGALHAGTRFGHGDSATPAAPTVTSAPVLAPAPPSRAAAVSDADVGNVAADERTTTPVPSAANESPAAAATPSAADGSLAGARAVEPAPAASGASLRAELELISAVQAALRDRRPARALELVDRHAALYPQGQLETERLAADAIAACQSGNEARGRRAARLFLQRDPTSALAARVRSACPSAGSDPGR
jgi:hypothetical protein